MHCERGRLTVRQQVPGARARGITEVRGCTRQRHYQQQLGLTRRTGTATAPTGGAFLKRSSAPSLPGLAAGGWRCSGSARCPAPMAQEGGIRAAHSCPPTPLWQQGPNTRRLAGPIQGQHHYDAWRLPVAHIAPTSHVQAQQVSEVGAPAAPYNPHHLCHPAWQPHVPGQPPQPTARPAAACTTCECTLHHGGHPAAPASCSQSIHVYIVIVIVFQLLPPALCLACSGVV